MEHSHIIIDKDNHFIIDPVTRKIRPETHEKNKLVEGDHKSERYTFELPKIIEGHDMSECNVIQLHYLNASADKSKKVEDIYDVDDLGILESKPDTLAFTWLIKEPATRYSGLLSFAIVFKCTTGDVIDYAWHTEIYSNISIAKSMNNSAAIVEEYSDILAQWKEELFGVEGKIQTALRDSLAIIENESNKTLSSINTKSTEALSTINKTAKDTTTAIEQKSQEVVKTIEDYGAVQVSEEEPTNPNVDLYINPNEKVTVSIPEIDDENVSIEDTWSSKKISEETTRLKEDLKGFVPKNQGVENNGKILGIGEDGLVVPIEKPSGGGDLDATLTSPDKAAPANLVGNKTRYLKKTTDNLEKNTLSELYTASEELTPLGWNMDGNALAENGTAIKNTESKILAYAVKEGNVYHLNLTKESPCVFLWVNAYWNPNPVSNLYLVGDPVNTALNGFITAPPDAKYLYVSQLKTNSTNSVRNVSKLINALEMSVASDKERANAQAEEMLNSLFVKNIIEPPWRQEGVSFGINGKVNLKEGNTTYVYKNLIPDKRYYVELKKCNLCCSSSLKYPLTPNLQIPIIGSTIQGDYSGFFKIPKEAKYLYLSVTSDDVNSGIYDTVSNDKILEEKTPTYEQSFSMFSTFGIIGDSYASGAVIPDGISVSPSEYGKYTHYDKSWGKIIERRYGSICTPYSYPGLTTETWLTNKEYGLEKMAQDTAKDLYIIVLGINDVQIKGVSYLGTISDFNLTDYNSAPNTFYGNMAKIIGNIKNKNENSKIIISTMANNKSGSTYEKYNNAMIEIANNIGVPVIKQFEHWYFKSDAYTTRMMTGHPTIPNYSGMGLSIATMIEEAISKNEEYFKDYIGV